METFDSNELRAIAAIEGLRVNNSKHFNTVEYQGKAFAWKEPAFLAAYEIFKDDIIFISKTLEQIFDKAERSQEFAEKEHQLTEDEKNEIINKNRELNKIIPTQAQLLEASRKIPLQYHVELCHFAYEL